MKDGKLEVGDILHVSHLGVLFIYKIAKVTKTMAISEKGKKFRILVIGGRVSIIGASKWGPFSAELETQELRDRYEFLELKSELEGVVNKLSLDQLRKIKQIISE